MRDEINQSMALMNTKVDSIRQDFDAFKAEFGKIKSDVLGIGEKVSNNIEPRVSDCEGRIAAVEDDLRDNIGEINDTLGQMQIDEYPPDTTVVCIGLAPVRNEDITIRAQELVTYGLGLQHVNIERSMRLTPRSNKPGLVKIKLPTKEDKIKVLRCKRNLKDNNYAGVFLRSSMTHTDRVMQHNLITLLKEIPNGDKFRVAGNGKLVPKDERNMGAWARGPPVPAEAGANNIH